MSVNVPDAVSEKLIGFAKEMWFGMPKWLRYMLVTTVIVGALYFLYNRLTISYDVSGLHDEITILNERCEKTVFYDRYQYDIQNVVTSFKTLQIEVRTLITFNKELLELLEEQHSENREKFAELKQRYEYTMKSYIQVVDYQVNNYEEWLKAGKHRNFFDTKKEKKDEFSKK